MDIEKRKLLQELWKLNHGKVLREYLDDKIKELTNVKNCISWEDTLGRQYALRILNELFSFDKEPSEVQPKTRYD
jgi:hypothetical protein